MLLLAAGVLFAGCSSVGNMNQATGTNVQLNQKNYKVIKAGAMGQSWGFRLLGIIPFASPEYAAAKQRLYASVGDSMNGKAAALANETEDRSVLYLILFSVPRLTLSADVIEFTDSK